MSVINHPRQQEGRERIQQTMSAMNRLTCYVHLCARKHGAGEFYTHSVLRYAQADLARGVSLATIKPRVYKAFRCADRAGMPTLSEVRNGR